MIVSKNSNSNYSASSEINSQIIASFSANVTYGMYASMDPMGTTPATPQANINFTMTVNDVTGYKTNQEAVDKDFYDFRNDVIDKLED